MSRALFRILLFAWLSVPVHAQPAKPEWTEYDGVKLPVPPRVHPRLFLRPEQVSDLESRLRRPELKDALDKLSHSKSRIYLLEWRALNYLIDRNPGQARALIEDTLATLNSPDTTDPGNRDNQRYAASRLSSDALTPGAIVYDWCYDQLTPKDKADFYEAIIRLAKKTELGYPPVPESTLTGHSSENMLMRDLISAGIALYDEHPEVYRYGAKLFFKEYIPARNWFYPYGAFHQSTSYNPYRFYPEVTATFIFDRLGFGNVFDPRQQTVPYQWLYMKRPDGQYLRTGDVGLDTTPKGQEWTDSFQDAYFLTANYYHDGMLLEEWMHSAKVKTENLIFQILWQDFDIQPRSHDSLPYTRHMGGPFGWTIARTGWGQASVIAEMKVNVYNVRHHPHLDAGAFQIYYHGPLAIDSGLYRGGTAGGNQNANWANYTQRTIAHNSLLIYNPGETFPNEYGKIKQLANDGGQRSPNGNRLPKTLGELLANPTFKTGEVLAHYEGPDTQQPDISYLKGDITRAYSEKVREVKRSFVFINFKDKTIPAALIVFDRIRAADPAYSQFWLLHSLEEPSVQADQVIITRTAPGENGKLVLTPLLPETNSRNIEKIGGPGKEFWIFGKNFPCELIPGKTPSAEPGAWRIQISPKQKTRENRFLNVMQVTDRGVDQYHKVEKIETDQFVGVIIRKHVVLFQKESGRVAGAASFRLPQTGEYRVFISDLAPGKWQMTRDQEAPVEMSVAAEAGSLYFTGNGGEYHLER